MAGYHQEGVRLYTDGSGDRQKFGAWAWALYHDGLLCDYQSRGAYPVTVNQMELMGAIMALQGAGFDECEVWSDSQYLVHGAMKHIHKWRKRGWITVSGKPVKNLELWVRLGALIDRYQPQFRWVKGHSGVPGNEWCDFLASRRRKHAIATTPKVLGAG